MALERLQKIISRSGLTSRRKAEEWILEGKVSVDGKVVRELGSKADWNTSKINVNGTPVRPPSRLLYLALHKPRGYITTRSDPEHRPTVMDLIKKVKEPLYPVGRLDFHSEGLLLMTNDGDFANHLMSSSNGILKTYWVKVKGLPDEVKIEKLRQGIPLDGRRTLPARIRLLKKTGGATRDPSANSWYEVIIGEGRQNQIRRMFDFMDHPVQKLKRVKIGPLSLGNLPIGEARHLTFSEVRRLMEQSPAAQKARSEKTPREKKWAVAKPPSSRQPRPAQHSRRATPQDRTNSRSLNSHRPNSNRPPRGVPQRSYGRIRPSIKP